MIKAIFFDLQGVLTKTGRLFSKDLPKAWEPEVRIEETIRRYYKYRTLKKIDKKDFFKDVPLKKKKLFLNFSKIHSGAKIAVETLSKKYPLYVASNHIDYIFESELKQIKLKKYFTDFIVSKDIGVAKPNKKFYEIMLKKAKVKGNEAIFIDDTKTNLKTAKKLGIITVWVNNKTDNPRNQIKFKPDYEISNLKELIKIVKDIEKKQPANN